MRAKTKKTGPAPGGARERFHVLAVTRGQLARDLNEQIGLAAENLAELESDDPVTAAVARTPKFKSNDPRLTAAVCRRYAADLARRAEAELDRDASWYEDLDDAARAAARRLAGAAQRRRR